MNVITRKQIDEYKTPDVEAGIKHISEIFTDLVGKWKSNPNAIFGIPTKDWPIFNQAFGGIREGELITITAETGSGKTTFAMNMIHQYLKQNIKCLVVSLEIPMLTIATIISQMISNKPFKMFDASTLGGVGEVLKTLPLYFLETYGMTDENFILKTITFAGKELGVKFIMLDHLDYIKKNRGENWMGESYVIGNTMRALCSATRNANATTLLIVHPSKLNSHGTMRREVGMDELKGSSSIKQESDAVLSIFRPRPSENVTQLRFLKIRDGDHGTNVESKIRYTYHSNSRILEEISTQLEWGND